MTSTPTEKVKTTKLDVKKSTATLATSTTSAEEGYIPPESCFKKFLQFFFVILLIIGAMIYMNPTQISPVHVTLQPLPVVNVNYHLDYVETIFRSRRSLKGAESIAIHPTNGFLYSGTQDGKIVRANLSKPYSSSPETLGVMGNPNAALPLPCGTYTTEPICGRPLGMQFTQLRHDNEQDPVLFLADAYLGIALHNPRTHQLYMLVNESFKTIDGQSFSQPMIFNDVAYDQNANKIYFTVSSTQFRLNDLFFDLLSLKASGMVCSYDLNTKEIEVIAKDIGFANGLIYHPKKKALFVSELSRARILRINVDWTQKNKKSTSFGQVSIFADNLPILPDNLAFIGDDEIWAAGVNLRVASIKNDDVDASLFPGFLGFSLFDLLANYPKLRLFISKAIPAQYAKLFTSSNPGGIVRLDINSGEVIELMLASKGHKNAKTQGVGLSIASITPHLSPELPSNQIHVYIGGYTPENTAFGRLTWDLEKKAPIQSTNQHAREQLRNQYRQQQKENNNSHNEL